MRLTFSLDGFFIFFLLNNPNKAAEALDAESMTLAAIAPEDKKAARKHRETQLMSKTVLAQAFAY